MAEELTPGEVVRTFRRQDDAIRATNDRVAELAKDMLPVGLWSSEHRALQGEVTHLASDMAAGFTRVEERSQERKAQLHAKDTELEGQIDDLRREIRELRAELREMREERVRRSEGTWQKVIGLIGAFGAIALVVVTLLNTGGH